MTILYTAVKRFAPDCREDWGKYIEGSGLTQLREIVSLDGLLCPNLVDEIQDSDWEHLDSIDSKYQYFRDFDYLLGRLSGTTGFSLLAVCQSPILLDLNSFDDPRFEFCGFDLLEREGGIISALVDCGGFPEAFDNTELSECGLLTELDRANEVRRLLRQKYPREHHAYCDVWAIWKMTIPLGA